MKYLDCQGYVLKSISLSDADKIFTIFSKEYGKTQAVARGIRKSTAKLAGFLQPFCELNLSLVKGKNLNIIIGAQQATSKEVVIPSEPAVLQSAYYFSELCNSLLAENQVNIAAYKLYKQCLRELARTKNQELVVLYFGLNFLKVIGSQPNLSSAKLTSKNYLVYDSANIVNERPNEHYGIISADTIKLWRLVLNNDLTLVNKLKNIDQAVVAGQKLLNNYYEYHFGFVSKSLQIFR